MTASWSQFFLHGLDLGTAAARRGQHQGKLDRQPVTFRTIIGGKEGPHLRQRVGQDVGVGVSGPEEPGDGIAPGIRLGIC